MREHQAMIAARASARRSLDQYWHAPRDAWITQADARDAASRMVGGILYPFDYAALDAILVDLTNGGLIEREVDDSGLGYRYRRPSVEAPDPTAPQQATPPPVMYHRGDGSPARPFVDVLREEQEKQAAAASAVRPGTEHGSTFDE